MSPKFTQHYFYLIFLLFSFSYEQNDKKNYFFTMYPSHNNKTSYLIHSFTPYSEHLTIDLSAEEEENLIKKEHISDYSNNISSIIFYKEDYLIKTCFGSNKIVEIIPLEEIDRDYKSESQIKTRYIYSQLGLHISQNLKYCYSSIVSNPDTSQIKDEEVIITYWVEITPGNSFTHKALLFYPKKKKFSKVYNLISKSLFPLNKRYPLHCTTFRKKDIFCSYYDLDLNNQYVIETNKIPFENLNNPSVHFVLGDFGQINGKNMVPISLNKQQKSIFGGYYDVFLAEFSEKERNNNEKNNTVILYSLYRKSLHISLVPMFSVLDLFFGINIRDDYIETNLFNYLLEGNEIVFIFIYNNMLQAIRVDYSKEHNIFKKSNDFRDLGYYSSKIANCKKQRFMRSSYVNSTIKYTNEEKAIVQNGTRQYIYEKDIVTVLSCETNEGKINYVPKIIKPPQCLIDLDSLNSHDIHKIKFYLGYEIIIYDIYDDIRLKSFRNVGIMFYEIEPNYKGLIIHSIKLKSQDKYIFPRKDQIYYDITHIKFQRILANYVPYFTKPFYLKYRLFNTETKEKSTINKFSSSLCFFQIKFFPFKDPSLIKPSEEEEEENEPFEINDECSIAECSLCIKTDVKNNYNGFICQKCDSSQLEVMIPDTNIKSETYGACICNTSLGFKKDPVINTCFCQEDNAYYKSTNLCWPLSLLESGPFYTDKVDDITEIPIYDDCYFSCAKCSKGGNETNHNCDKCKEGFAYIDDDKSNCYNKSLLNEGYHEIDKDKYIKCHDNCISCKQKFSRDKQYCTECRKNVSYFIRENPQDDYFNCFSEKCEDKTPKLLYNYDINSHECVSDCNEGFKPYNNFKVCLAKCSKDFPYLDKDTNICYDNCEKNPTNKVTNIDQGTCVNKNECKDNNNNDDECKIISECNGDRKYKDKEGNCLNIPEQCLVVDINTKLCKICNEKFYPLKEEIYLESFKCYKNLEEIIKDKNKSNYYLNETEGYWEKCYSSCETCYAYGSENRQRCSKCKPHYHMQTYSLNSNDNIYNNCLLDLTPNENCTSSQIDMYKYKDFCHLCQNEYAFINGFDKCLSEKELSQGPFYSKYENKLTGENRDKTIIVKVYYNCYKYCKSCEEKGDFYDNKCKSCIDGFLFNPKSKFDNCISLSDLVVETTIINNNNNNNNNDNNDINKNSDKSEDNSDNIKESELIQDSDANIWFNLGKNSFYIYQQNKCYLIFYHSELILISNRESCNNICPIWSAEHCPLKKYERFRTLSKKEFNNLISNTNVYSEIKNDVNLFISEEEQRIYFHLTNNASPSPKNISYIDLGDYNKAIKSKFKKNLLLIKADIKRNDTQSTQVEYQFFDPNDLAIKIDLEKNIAPNKRRLNDENKAQINIELPVDWTQEQKENINYLYTQNIDAFDSSSDFYTDNCNQFTSSKGNDVFLEERKKKYYPDITLCEQGCSFVKYNKDTEKVTCKCDYKINSNNYTNVVFVKNEKDKKFLKNIILENIQAMKCIKVIFKWNNLKSNAGFIIMIIFLILFTLSGVLYYIKGGSHFLDKFLKESVEREGIIYILKIGYKINITKKRPKNKAQKVCEILIEAKDRPENLLEQRDAIKILGMKKEPLQLKRINQLFFVPKQGDINNNNRSRINDTIKSYIDSSDFPSKIRYSTDSIHTQNNYEKNNNGNNQTENNNKIKFKHLNSESDLPRSKNYDIDSEYSGYKNSNKNNFFIDENNNKNKADEKKENKKQKQIKKEQEQEDKSKKDENIAHDKDEEDKEEKTEIAQGKPKSKKILKKQPSKNTDKSSISGVQKIANYSVDSSMNSELYKRKDSNKDMISDNSNKKKHKDNKGEKSLISADSKENNKEENDIIEDIDFSMGNMSKINKQIFRDNSKKEEDIIKVMDKKNNKTNKKESNNDNIDMNLNINNVINKKKEDANIIKINDINIEDSLDTLIPKEEEGKNIKKN